MSVLVPLTPCRLSCRRRGAGAGCLALSERATTHPTIVWHARRSRATPTQEQLCRSQPTKHDAGQADENGRVSEIPAAPVSHRRGRDGDADLQAKAIGIKTVADLGKNKYVTFAKVPHELGV